MSPATFDQIAAQALRVEQARARVHREQERLTRLVAEAASAHPERATWYLHPGRLSLDQIRGAASLTELGLHRLMERYRDQHAEPPRKGPRR